MKYCKHCGNRLEKHHRFCISCGAEIVPSGRTDPAESETDSPPTEEADDKQSVDDGESTLEQEPPVQTRQTSGVAGGVSRSSVKQGPGSPRRKMKNSTKIILAVAILILVSLGGAHFILSSYYDPMNDLQAMDKAVSSGDAEAFMEYIDLNSEALFNEEDYFQYIKSSQWDSVKQQYQEVIEKDDVLSSTITDSTGETLFSVQPEEHIIGLYKTYALTAEPSNLTVHTTMDDTDIQIGDVSDTLQPEESKTIPGYPGSYTLTGESSSLFGDFSYNESIDITSKADEEITIEFSGNTHAFSTDKEDAILFVNGEDTGVKLDDIDELGPFPDNETVKMHAQWTTPDGDIKESDTVTPEDAQTFGGIPFLFDEDENSEQVSGSDSGNDEDSPEISGEDASDMVLEFRNAYENALNTKDYGKIDDYLEHGSEAEKELKEYVGDLKDTDYDYDFTSDEVVDTDEVDDETVAVTTNEQFIFTNHLDEETDYDRLKTYTVKWIDDDYKIHSIEYDETDRDRQ